MKYRFWIVLLVGIAVSLIVVALLYTGYLRFNYPSYEDFPVQGIDVSHHQGDIDWGEVANENISFAFIKATEGVDFKDKKFIENWKAAQEMGIAVGAYHFYRLCKKGHEQADHFITTVPKYAGALPPVVDLEYGGNCSTDMSQEEIEREIHDYLLKVGNHYGQLPIIYVTQEFYNDYLINKLIEYPIWIRDIYNRPSLHGGRRWVFWQYANRGHLNGIGTYVDLNAFEGDEIQFSSFLKTGRY